MLRAHMRAKDFRLSRTGRNVWTVIWGVAFLNGAKMPEAGGRPRFWSG